MSGVGTSETSRRDQATSAYEVKAVVPADIVRRPNLTQPGLPYMCAVAPLLGYLADVAGGEPFPAGGIKGRSPGASERRRERTATVARTIHRPAFAAAIGRCQPCGPRATAVGKIERRFVIATKRRQFASLLDCKLSLRLRADRPDGRGTFVPLGQTCATCCCFVSLPAGP